MGNATASSAKSVKAALPSATVNMDRNIVAVAERAGVMRVRGTVTANSWMASPAVIMNSASANVGVNVPCQISNAIGVATMVSDVSFIASALEI